MNQQRSELFLKIYKEHCTQEGHVIVLPQREALFYPELLDQAQGSSGPEPKHEQKLVGIQSTATKTIKTLGNRS